MQCWWPEDHRQYFNLNKSLVSPLCTVIYPESVTLLMTSRTIDEEILKFLVIWLIDIVELFAHEVFHRCLFFKLVVLLINMWLVFIETSQNFSFFLLFCLCAILNKYVQWCTNGCITYILDSIPTFTTEFIFRRTYTGIYFPNLGSSLPWLGVFMLNGRYGKHPYNNNDFYFT